jgi:hypothetical protein
MTTKTSLVVMACFALSLLVVFDFAVKPSYAQAFEVITDIEQPIMGMSYSTGTGNLYVLAEGSGFTWLHEIDPLTFSLIKSFNATEIFDDNAMGITMDIWCGKTSCYVTSTEGMARVNIEPSIGEPLENITGTVFSPAPASDAGFYHITGRDEVTAGFGTVTIWVDSCTEAVVTCDGAVRTIDGISMQIVSTASPYNTNNLEVNKIHDMEWSQISGSIDNNLVIVHGITTDTASTNFLKVYNLAASPPSVLCSVQLPSQNNPFSVATNYNNELTNQKIYVGSIDGIMYVYDDACNLLQTISSAQTGLSNDIRFIQYQSGRIFMQDTGSNAVLSQMLVNSTGHVLTTSASNTYFPFPTVSQDMFRTSGYTLSITMHDMLLFAGNGFLIYPYTGADERVGRLIYDASAGGGGGNAGGGNQVDGRCGVGTALDCVGDRSLINQVTGGTSWGTLGNALFGGIGLVNTTASNDIKDNGTGLLLMLMLGAFFSSITIATIGVANSKFGAGISYTEIPKEYWLFLVIGVVAVAYYLQWIPDIVFYTLVLGMAGLFSFGLYKHIRGG